MSDINITIKDRDGHVHKILAPTDMAMNIMEIVRSYELAPEGTIGVCGGMAMCASCQCYVHSKHAIPEKGASSSDSLDPSSSFSRIPVTAFTSLGAGRKSITASNIV